MPDELNRRPGRFGPIEMLLVAGATALLTATLTFLSVRLGDRAEGPSLGMSPALVIHLATVVPALPLGAYLLIRRKGDRLHRLLGRIWGGLMMITALASFWIRDISEELSFIHIFSIVTLVAIPRAVLLIRRGNVDAHGRIMTGVYIGLVVAGIFAFLPERLLGDWLWR